MPEYGEPMAKYRVITGIEYLGKRAEAGTVVSDIPAKSIKWLRESGIIEPADKDAIDADDEPAEEAE